MGEYDSSRTLECATSHFIPPRSCISILTRNWEIFVSLTQTRSEIKGGGIFEGDLPIAFSMPAKHGHHISATHFSWDLHAECFVRTALICSGI